MVLLYVAAAPMPCLCVACKAWHMRARLASKSPSAVYEMQFRSPEGKLRATVEFKNYNTVWGRAVSQDGRSAYIHHQAMHGNHY
jgi:hypothetical protein